MRQQRFGPDNYLDLAHVAAGDFGEINVRDALDTGAR